MHIQENDQDRERRRQAYLRWCKAVDEALGQAPRRQETLHWVAKGLSNKEISQKMLVSSLTVKSQIALAVRALEPLRKEAGVVTLTRTGLAVILTRARLFPLADDVAPDFDESVWRDAVLYKFNSSIEMAIIRSLVKGHGHAEVAMDIGVATETAKYYTKYLQRRLSRLGNSIGIEKMARASLAALCIRARLC